MGDVLSSLGSLGNDVFQGIGSVGSELWQGAQGLLSDVGTGLGGLFGGGSPIGPGTIGGGGASLSLPSAVGSGSDVLGQVGAAAPAASTSAAAFGLAPGVAADASSIVPGVSPGAVNVPPISPGISATGIDTSVGSLVPGVNANPALGGGGGSFLSKVLSNPKLLGEGGLALTELLKANQKPPGLAELQALSQQQAGFAKNQGELALGESQGLLPAGAEGLFQGVLDANLSAIRSKYASMGMTGSSAETEDLNNARTAILGQIFQQGQSMASQGFTNVNQATGYESTLLSEIMNAEISQGSDLGNALALFAGAASK